MIFSNADVIRRVNADFVPVALKAGLINNPPDNDEGRLYREIGRSKILPQGVCVVNSAGKVLDWVFMFDDDKSVLDFLDRPENLLAILSHRLKVSSLGVTQIRRVRAAVEYGQRHRRPQRPHAVAPIE